MSNTVKSTRNSPQRARGLSLGSAVVAAVVLAAASVTVVSNHRVKNAETQVAPIAGQRAKAPEDRRKFSPTNQSIQAQDLTPEAADRLAAGLGEMIDPSADGLTQVRHADGSVSVDLNGHFQNVVVGKVERNGRAAQSCVDNPESAGAFFGLNPNRITSLSPKTRLPK